MRWYNHTIESVNQTDVDMLFLLGDESAIAHCVDP